MPSTVPNSSLTLSTSFEMGATVNPTYTWLRNPRNALLSHDHTAVSNGAKIWIRQPKPCASLSRSAQARGPPFESCLRAGNTGWAICWWGLSCFVDTIEVLIPTSKDYARMKKTLGKAPSGIPFYDLGNYQEKMRKACDRKLKWQSRRLMGPKRVQA